MRAAVVAAVAVVAALSCTSPDRARSTLEASGFTLIKLTGYDAFSCGKGDATCTGFEATGPTGRRVHGAVGCGFGFGKGCTVRIDP